MNKVICLLFALMLVGQTTAQSRRGAPATAEKANRRSVLSPKTQTPETPTAGEDPAENSGDVVKVETELVTVPVRIMDKKGRFVGGLVQGDFKVLEDGVDQNIAYFSNESEPFTVALVLDMSYSTTFKLAEVQSAAIAFIDQLREQDKVMVVSFDEEVHVLCEPTSDRRRIYSAIKGTKISTGTSLYEAMDRVMNEKFRSIKGRKAIILFTDGVDTSSRESNNYKNLDDALELDALIYPIRYDTFADVQAMKNKPVIVDQTKNSPIPGRKSNGLPFPVSVIGTPDQKGTTEEDYRRAEEYLNELAVRTGGRIYTASTILNLGDAYSKIASELREFYSLGYYPVTESTAGKHRRIQVKVDQTGLVVRSRDGYVVGRRAAGKAKVR